MTSDIITDEPDLLIRRTILEPGEASHWHRDPCRRFTVVVRGGRLLIEYRGSDETTEVTAASGEAGWEAPQQAVHRAVNIGTDTFEEVVTFYRATAGQDPQPIEWSR